MDPVARAVIGWQRHKLVSRLNFKLEELKILSSLTLHCAYFKIETIMKPRKLVTQNNYIENSF